MMFSLEAFVPMQLVQTIPSGPVGQVLGEYFWQDNTLWFNGSNEARQLWLTYYAGPDAPASGVIGFANGRELNFLKNATAGHFAPKRQLPMGPQCMMNAFGESGIANGGDGMLRALIIPMLKQKQGRPVRAMRYRQRRPFIPITAY